jgi:prepilin-type processing-associated H-X9-DG protein
LQDITDGLSHTIIVAEDGGRPELYYGRQQVAGQTTKNGNGWADPDCNFSVSGILEDGFPGGPCVINCTNDSEIYSFHPGGSHFLFCDGSVRFVSDSVDGALLTAQVTRAGGETMIDVSSKD